MFVPGIFKNKTRKGKRGEDLPELHEGLPDSHRPSGLCPRCGKQSSFDIAGSLPATFDSSYSIDHSGKEERGLIDRVSSLICRHCNQPVVVVEEQWIGDHPAKEGKYSGIVNYRGINWWPLPEAYLSSDIPNNIAGVFAEAAKALYADCPRASAVMARRALEAICVDKGETSGILADRLDALKSKGILQPTLADWAKEVRLIGNVGAHFDPIQTVTMEDAKQLLSFLRELLKYLYELPAELARRKSEGKQSKNEASGS
jgi:hypothetical protein